MIDDTGRLGEVVEHVHPRSMGALCCGCREAADVLVDNLILTLYPFEPSVPAAADASVPAGEAARLYLSGSARERLYPRRPVAGAERVGPHRILQAHALRLDERLSMLVVLSSWQTHSVDVLRRQVDQLRLRRPLYPGQSLPTAWPRGCLKDQLEAWLPAHQPVLEDARLPVYTYAAVRGSSLTPAQLHGLIALDSPDLPGPPEDLWQRVLRERCYRRWERAGTLYGFTHISGACIHCSAEPPRWLLEVHRSVYVDVFTWTIALAARRRQAVEAALAGQPRPPEWAHWESERLTEQDQGRQLHRLWSKVIEQDARTARWTR